MKHTASEVLLRRLDTLLRERLPAKLAEYSDEQLQLEAPQLIQQHESEINLFPAIKLLWQATDYEQLVEETNDYELRKTVHTVLIDVIVAGNQPDLLVWTIHRYVAAIEDLIQSATSADKVLDFPTQATGLLNRFGVNLDPTWKILRKYEFEQGVLGTNKSILVQRHLLDFEATY
jgi:hypothetical protein